MVQITSVMTLFPCRFSTIDDLKAFVLSLEGVDVGEPVAIQSSDGDSIVSYTKLIVSIIVYIFLLILDQ